ISEFRTASKIPPSKSKQPWQLRRMKKQRRPLSLFPTPHRSHKKSHQPHLRRRRKLTRLKILPCAASDFRRDARKSGARRDVLPLFLSFSPSLLRWLSPPARL